jgi:hypothetical protein
MNAIKDFERKSCEDGWILLSSVIANSFLKRKSNSQGNPRLEVPRTFLKAGIKRFQDHVQNSCAEFVINSDKIGISEWEDRAERRVLVLSTMREQTTFLEIHRNLKQISIVHFFLSIFALNRFSQESIWGGNG